MSDSFNIREAKTADALAIALLHVNTFNETHGAFNAPTLDTREWQWQKAFRANDGTWFCFVIEKKDGALIGFAKGQPYSHIDHPQFAGELNKIYLLRAYHKMGLGRQLICKVFLEFMRRGITSMLLFGDASNPSNKFYEQMGAKKLIGKNGAFDGGYGWTDLEKLAARCRNASPA